LPPVGAQNRKEIAVQLLIVDADDDYLSPQREVTPSALAAQAQGYAISALGSLKADFGIRD
jgi:hypothetical protein